jgi:hypothetical protein
MFEIENKLVLQLSRLGNFKFEVESYRRTIISTNFNWKYFTERCSDTMLSSIVYTCIKSQEELLKLLPEEYEYYLRQVQSQIIVKNTFLVSAFKDIIREFGHSGIDVIPLKGIYLIDSYYSNFSHRQISDIDLLVRDSQLEVACQYFLSRGFDMEMYMPASAAKVSKTPAPYKFSKNGLVIDLHIGLTYVYDSCQFNMDEVWRCAKKNEKGYFELKSLDHGLYLFAHLIKHFDYRNCKLINFYDLCLVMERDGTSFDDLFIHAELHGCKNDVLDICYLLGKYFELDSLTNLKNEYLPSRSNIDDVFLEILSTDRAQLELKYAPEGSTGFRPVAYLSKRNKFVYIFSRIFPDSRYIKSKYAKTGRSIIFKYIVHVKIIFSQFFRARKFSG